MIACNIIVPPPSLPDAKCRLRFVLPFNAELLLYDDFTTLHTIKQEFDGLTDMEQRAYLNAVFAEKLSV